MADSSVIIIGAGIAGLSAGCYARMNGYRTRIFEMHSLPGGVCTAWKRQGYTFDGCLHWLGGTAPGNVVHTIWQELGALQGRRIIYHPVFKEIVIGDRRLTVYTDLDRFAQALLEASPRDRPTIDEFAGQVRRFQRFDPPLGSPSMGLGDLVRMLPYAPSLLRYGRMSTEEYAARFHDPFLRQAFLGLFPLPDMPMFVAILNLALITGANAGYPEGGSLEFARAIERRYLGLGGEVQYNARVARILVEGGRAVGVRLADGGEHRADRVISAADGHATLFELLGDEYVDPRTRRYYQELAPFEPLVYISLGVNRDLSAEPPIVMVRTQTPYVVGDRQNPWLSWFHYCFDPTLAPQGKSVVSSMQETSYEYWAQIHPDRARYQAEKQKAADAFIAALDKYYPGIRAQIEVVDVATPMTWVRYTGNWRGAYEGWLPTRKAVATRMKKVLPGLDGFYMCGQWVQPGGGVPTAATSGRQAVQLMCRKDGRPFVTALP